MSLRHPMHRLSVDELLQRAASVANLAILRTYAKPSLVQIAAINECTTLLKLKLGSLPFNDNPHRARILVQLGIHQSVLAPIRRLPKELLIDIFFRVANEAPLRTLYVAVTLSRVCAVWREISHGLSKLWTNLVVKSMSDFDQYCELFLPITSKERRPGLRCDEPEMLCLLWDRIEPYASSWRSLTLVSRLNMLPDLKVLTMDNLERLVVDAYDAPHSSELSVLDFVVAPRLRHIALTLDTLQNERQLHVPVTRTLTSLEIDVMSPFPVTLILPLLHACADTLQSLTLKVRYPLDGPEGSYPTNPSETFVMKSLTFLSLVDPACALLNHITAPLVDEIILSNAPAYSSQSLLRFLMRDQASESLLVLRVYKAEEREPSAWLPCLRLMDRLMQLHFDDLLSNREFLEQMIVRADRPALLPSLIAIAILRTLRAHPELRELIGDMCTSRAKETTIGGRHAFLILHWIKD